MKIKVYFTLLIFSLLTSCCGTHTEVKYEYKGVVINRIDECGKTRFYYKNNQNQNSGKIWVEYSGINDGFSGYLKFYENGKVTLLSGDGDFQKENLDTTHFNYKRILAYERPELNESVCQIMFPAEYEQEKNKSSNSAVRLTYNIDQNDWW